LWDGKKLSSFTSGSLVNPLDFTLGLVEITISDGKGAGREPFSRTCWVFCGMGLAELSSAPRGEPWVQLAGEMNGNVEMLGETCHRSQLTNPFALSSLSCKLRAQGVFPNRMQLEDVCVVQCTAKIQLELRASTPRFVRTFLQPVGGPQVAVDIPMVTITGEQLENQASPPVF
jgi:hypothetical protein